MFGLQVEAVLDDISAVLLNEKAEWDAQRDAMMKLRQVIAGGGAEFECFTPKVLATVHRFAKLVRGSVFGCDAALPTARCPDR